MIDVMHYGVFRRSIAMRWPVCCTVGTLPLVGPEGEIHGMSIYRGDVNCDGCKQTMGIA